MLHLHPFVQSIAHINDSGTFESSFEIKYIQFTPQCQRNGRLNEFDSEDLVRCEREFQEQWAYNSNTKYSPKKIKRSNNSFANVGDINCRNFGQTSECPKDNLKEYILPRTFSQSPKSSRSNCQEFELKDMGCKPFGSYENENKYYDDNNVLLEHEVVKSSAETSYDMHPPLLASFNVTPRTTAAKQQQGNAACELAKFLRSSFHVKRAKITHLHRSLSDNEILENLDFPPAPLKPNTMTTEKTKKKVLEDTTNQRARGSTSSIRVSIFLFFF